MPWNVQVSDQVQVFLQGLTEVELTKVVSFIELLEEHGPHLKRPHADSLSGSRHPNMKELRIKCSTKEFRILFAFDPNQSGVLLFGGDKVPMGESRWYLKAIANADDAYDDHLSSL